MHPCLVTLEMTALQPSHCPRDTKLSPRPGWYSGGGGLAKSWLSGQGLVGRDQVSSPSPSWCAPSKGKWEHCSCTLGHSLQPWLLFIGLMSV